MSAVNKLQVPQTVSLLSIEPVLSSCTVKHGAEREAQPQQENPGPATSGESNSGMSAEVPGPSQSSADTGKKNWNYCLVQVGDVCLPGILPEGLSSHAPIPNSHSDLPLLASVEVTVYSSNTVLSISDQTWNYTDLLCVILFRKCPKDWNGKGPLGLILQEIHVRLVRMDCFFDLFIY